MVEPATVDSRRALPGVHQLLAHPAVAPLVAVYGRPLVTVQARAVLAAARARLAAGERVGAEVDAATLAPELAAALAAVVPPPGRRVLNATGVLLHTNLGRAPLPRRLAAALPGLLDAACDLELDLANGCRDERGRRVAALLGALTGAEAALVVNNNAAALVLVVATHAAGREVVVSRGELVEIGGSFRLPEILAAAGARLVEVGTTNRTRLDDYRTAVGPATGLLLKVFPSNYEQRGYVESVPPAALAGLGHALGVPLLVDEGSGLLRAHGASQLRDHPSHASLLAAGCDLVCGSGDKLLGGPQAGMLVGRATLVAACRRHPLYRALRPGRITLTSLEALLRARLAEADEDWPLERMWPPAEDLRARLEALRAGLGGRGEILPADAYLGGGSAPEQAIRGEALALPDRGRLATRLRTGEPAVVARERDGRVWLDLRTVDPADDRGLLAAVRAALAEVEAP